MTRPKHDIDPECIKLISPETSREYRIIPIAKNESTVSFYIDETKDIHQTKSELEVLLDINIELYPIPELIIDELLSKFYFININTENNSKRASFNINSEDFLLSIIKESNSLGSSDIHIEIYDSKARIRFRIDGVLVERHVIDIKQYSSIINRLKIMSNLDISEKRLPQDGRIFFNENGLKFDIRVSVLPTLYGEKIVLRLLQSGDLKVTLSNLGMSKDEQELYLEGISKTSGIILISGPTGSGKTTTLYATLKYLNNSIRNILTIEDPIEYTIDGINQVQLKENIGLGYANALRTFLRQDPDIIMIGEIRDTETAAMAVRASLTGHLVLSTIHTNSAWGTVSRLQDMGIASYLLADTINLSVAQRLIRVLCPNCKKEAPFIDYNLINKFNLLKDVSKQYLPAGCDYCFYTGYKGRKAIYEVINVNSAISTAIRDDISKNESIKKIKTYISLAENAVILFKNGETSFQEIYPILLSK